jgi:hypothetical protein
MTMNVAALVDPFTAPLPDFQIRTFFQRLRGFFQDAKSCREIDLQEMFRSPDLRHPVTRYPLLALAPIGVREIRFLEMYEIAGFHTSRSNINWGAAKDPNFFRIPTRQWQKDERLPSFGLALKTAVPAVPLSVFPTSHTTQKKTQVMFDTDWEEYTIDPFLIETLPNGKHKIVAEWDLTIIERKVLAFANRRLKRS